MDGVCASLPDWACRCWISSILKRKVDYGRAQIATTRRIETEGNLEYLDFVYLEQNLRSSFVYTLFQELGPAIRGLKTSSYQLLLQTVHELRASSLTLSVSASPSSPGK